MTELSAGRRFRNFEPQHQEIGEFHVVQKRRETNFAVL